MCLLIIKKREAVLEKELFARAWDSNNQGGGFAYIHENQLIIKKGYFDLEAFWNDYNNIQENKTCLIHFRLISAGEKNEENCHPFEITPNLCYALNGTISDFKVNNAKESDSFNFNETVLKELIGAAGEDFVFNSTFYYIIDKIVGSSNKLVFLNNREEFLIVNENKGSWNENKTIWFSNDSHKEKPIYTSEKKRYNNYKYQSSRDGIGSDSNIIDTEPFLNRKGKHGKQKFGYCIVAGGPLLTSREIGELVSKKRYGKKLRVLVKENLIVEVKLNKDGSIQDDLPDQGRAGLDIWFQKKGSKVENPILDGCIIVD